MYAHRQRLTVKKGRELKLLLPPDFPTGLVEVIVLSDGSAESTIDVPQRQSAALDGFFALLGAMTPSGRSSQEIAQQVRQERDAWEN